MSSRLGSSPDRSPCGKPYVSWSEKGTKRRQRKTLSGKFPSTCQRATSHATLSIRAILAVRAGRHHHRVAPRQSVTPRPGKARPPVELARPHGANPLARLRCVQPLQLRLFLPSGLKVCLKKGKETLPHLEPLLLHDQSESTTQICRSLQLLHALIRWSRPQSSWTDYRTCLYGRRRRQRRRRRRRLTNERKR